MIFCGIPSPRICNTARNSFRYGSSTAPSHCPPLGRRITKNRRGDTGHGTRDKRQATAETPPRLLALWGWRRGGTSDRGLGGHPGQGTRQGTKGKPPPRPPRFLWDGGQGRAPQAPTSTSMNDTQLQPDPTPETPPRQCRDTQHKHAGRGHRLPEQGGCCLRGIQHRVSSNSISGAKRSVFSIANRTPFRCRAYLCH